MKNLMCSSCFKSSLKPTGCVDLGLLKHPLSSTTGSAPQVTFLTATGSSGAAQLLSMNCLSLTCTVPAHLNAPQVICHHNSPGMQRHFSIAFKRKVQVGFSMSSVDFTGVHKPGSHSPESQRQVGSFCIPMER